jgi:hypothetical protein
VLVSKLFVFFAEDDVIRDAATEHRSGSLPHVGFGMQPPEPDSFVAVFCQRSNMHRGTL